MNLITPAVNKRNLEVGDIVVWDNEVVGYLVIKINGKYVCHSLNGDFGAVGHHDTLEKLEKAIINCGKARIFSHKEYQLMLTLKEKK